VINNEPERKVIIRLKYSYSIEGVEVIVFILILKYIRFQTLFRLKILFLI